MKYLVQKPGYEIIYIQVKDIYMFSSMHTIIP